MKTNNPIQGYKGFDENLQCRGFQYEVGKEYETDKAIACNTGFHFCEFPFNVWEYYSPANENGLNRFCEVEGSGEIDDSENDKTCCTHLKIKAEIGINSLIKAGVKFIMDRVKWDNAATNTGYQSAATNTGDCSAATNTGDGSAATNTGDQSAATNTGDCSAATNTGNYSAATNTGNYSAATNTGNRSAATNTGNYSAATNTGYQSAATNTGNYSAATNTGDCSAASVEGKESIAIVTGRDSKAKGAIGCWIVLTERSEWNGNIYPIKFVKAFKVDGTAIKPDVYYKLVDGQPVEVND